MPHHVGAVSPAGGDIAGVLLGVRRGPAAERREVGEGRVVVVVRVPAGKDKGTVQVRNDHTLVEGRNTTTWEATRCIAMICVDPPMFTAATRRVAKTHVLSKRERPTTEGCWRRRRSWCCRRWRTTGWPTSTRRSAHRTWSTSSPGPILLVITGQGMCCHTGAKNIALFKAVE
jgi:hypothetical protein